MKEPYNKNNRLLEEANNKIILLTMEIEALTDKINIKEKLLLASNKEREELNLQLVIILREIDEANKKLKELDKLKSAFVSNVSHEFKNPLFIIRDAVSVVLEGLTETKNTKQKEMLEMVVRNANRMLRLVMNLLDISKIESGKMEMEIEEIQLASLLEEILEEYRSEISKKGINLKKNIFANVGVIQADKDKMIEVIVNLLSNAIKYTSKGGDIFIKLEGQDKEVRFEISDTGPGIAEENIAKIFDKFERVTAEKQEGTGLGLPIAKDIVELHKGKMWAESEFGKGSKFIFTIPRVVN